MKEEVERKEKSHRRGCAVEKVRDIRSSDSEVESEAECPKCGLVHGSK